MSDLISELNNEILESITEQTELERDSLSMMTDGNSDEITVSLTFPDKS